MPGRSAGEKYTDPKLRERIKRDLMRSGKGGRPGQWSARKSHDRARALDVPGRSRMNKAQLYEAVVAAEAEAERIRWCSSTGSVGQPLPTSALR